MNLNLIYHFSEKSLTGERTGHDWSHAMRVEKNADEISPKQLSKKEIEIIKASSWLHDTIDPKLSASKRKTIDEVKKVLEKAKASPESIKEILYIIQNLSYSKNLEEKKELSFAGEIVQDADRLDAIGAIGIARTFYYGGSKGHSLYNDEKARKKSEITENNYHQQTSIINHFHEKLLLLKETMNTEKAKIIADERTEFMKVFLDQLNTEVNIKSDFY